MLTADFVPSAEQAPIIAHEDGHALVTAVAGSGKSRTLVERVARLVEGGCQYDAIAVLMFNAAAADEFAGRLAQRMPHLPSPPVLTFHAFGQQLCRRLERAGLLARARLIEDDEAQQLAKKAMETAHRQRGGLHRFDPSPAQVDEFLSVVDVLKGARFAGGEIPGALREGVEPLHLAAYGHFERLRTQSRVRTFADLICDPLTAADADPRARTAITGRFAHVIIDEFQDINDAQMALCRLVAGERASVMAVGDDDQTIYGWRGARPDYMVTLFEREFPGTRRYALTRTFRYGHSLSLLANAVIENNRNRIAKLCVSAPGCGATEVVVRLYPSGATSAARVCDELRAWRASGRAWSETVVLVRQFAHVAPIEMAMREQGIPYRTVGTTTFAASPEVRALRVALLLAGREGEYPPEWPGILRREMVRAALTVPRQFWPAEALRRALDHVEGGRSLSVRELRDTLAAAAGSHAISGVGAQVLSALAWASNRGRHADAYEVLRGYIEHSGMMAALARSAGTREQREARLNVVRALLRFAHGHTAASLHDALCEAELANAHEGEGRDAVLITSVHRAKGLEWPCVIVPELAEGVFPAAGADIEDERRLFYVAATRARELLVLAAPFDADLIEWSRARASGAPPSNVVASRFLYEAALYEAQEIGRALAVGDTPSSDAASLAGRYLLALQNVPDCRQMMG